MTCRSGGISRWRTHEAWPGWVRLVLEHTVNAARWTSAVEVRASRQPKRWSLPQKAGDYGRIEGRSTSGREQKYGVRSVCPSPMSPNPLHALFVSRARRVGSNYQLLDATAHEQIAILGNLQMAVRMASERGGAVWRDSVDNRGHPLGASVLLLPRSVAITQR